MMTIYTTFGEAKLTNAGRLSKKDALTDWYSKLGDKKTKPKVDKNFKHHLIKPNSMISVIGPTGSGKSSFLVEFIARKPNAFYEIIIFNPANVDEPLYNYLIEKIEGVKFIDDVAELPNLEDFKDEDKTEENS